MLAAKMPMAKIFTAKLPRTYITTKNVTLIWLSIANSELVQDKEAAQTEIKGESPFGLFLHTKIRMQWHGATVSLPLRKGRTPFS